MNVPLDQDECMRQILLVVLLEIHFPRFHYPLRFPKGLRQSLQTSAGQIHHPKCLQLHFDTQHSNFRFPPMAHTRLTSTKRFTNLNCDASQTLDVVNMKSDFHTVNKKKYLGSKLNFVFYTCLLQFTLGLTILAGVRKVRQVYVNGDFKEMLE